MKSLLFSFLLITCIIGIIQAVCPKDPSEWCKTVEAASECDVFDQCLKNVWRPINPYFDSKLLLKSQADADLVNLTLYYETLCPDCRGFMTGQVWTAYNSVASIMNLTLVPYGNAKQAFDSNSGTWNFTCQHGPDECYGNLIHSCFLYYYPVTSDHMPFVNCMESTDGSVKDVATKCASDLQINLSDTWSCTTSKLGNILQHNNAVLTENLKPTHTYVPWVTLNGVHTETIEQEAEKDLVKLICHTYKGTTKPAACKN